VEERQYRIMTSWIGDVELRPEPFPAFPLELEMSILAKQPSPLVLWSVLLDGL